MSDGSFGQVASIATTVVLVVCAVTVTSVVVRREFFDPPRALAATRPDTQPDWASYADGGHRIGPSGARAVMIEFSDFQCPACRQFEDRLRVTRARFPNDFAIQYRHFPLTIHKFARDAAIASECGAKQASFARIHAALFDMRDSFGLIPWRQIASTAGVRNLDTFDKCMADARVAAIVDRDVADAKRLGARGTPTVLINGMRFSGSLSQAVLDSVVGAAVRRAEQPLR